MAQAAETLHLETPVMVVDTTEELAAAGLVLSAKAMISRLQLQLVVVEAAEPEERTLDQAGTSHKKPAAAAVGPPAVQEETARKKMAATLVVQVPEATVDMVQGMDQVGVMVVVAEQVSSIRLSRQKAGS